MTILLHCRIFRILYGEINIAVYRAYSSASALRLAKERWWSCAQALAAR